MIFIRFRSSSALRFPFADLPGTWPHSTYSFTSLPSEKFNSLFQNKLKRGIRKTDGTKEEESMHSGNLPLFNWRVCHLYDLKQFTLSLTCRLSLSVQDIASFINSVSFMPTSDLSFYIPYFYPKSYISPVNISLSVPRNLFHGIPLEWSFRIRI